jgi:hypothetical protein
MWNALLFRLILIQEQDTTDGVRESVIKNWHPPFWMNAIYNLLESATKWLIYCTFTAAICKSLIINGAGEGNRTLVSIFPNHVLTESGG